MSVNDGAAIYLGKHVLDLKSIGSQARNSSMLLFSKQPRFNAKVRECIHTEISSNTGIVLLLLRSLKSDARVSKLLDCPSAFDLVLMSLAPLTTYFLLSRRRPVILRKVQCVDTIA